MRSRMQNGNGLTSVAEERVSIENRILRVAKDIHLFILGFDIKMVWLRRKISHAVLSLDI